VMHLIGESSKHAPARSLISFHRSAYRFYRNHITRTTWHPLNVVAITGLSMRIAAVLGWRGISQFVKAIRQTQHTCIAWNKTLRNYVRSVFLSINR